MTATAATIAGIHFRTRADAEKFRLAARERFGPRSDLDRVTDSPADPRDLDDLPHVDQVIRSLVDSSRDPAAPLPPGVKAYSADGHVLWKGCRVWVRLGARGYRTRGQLVNLYRVSPCWVKDVYATRCRVVRVKGKKGELSRPHDGLFFARKHATGLYFCGAAETIR